MLDEAGLRALNLRALKFEPPEVAALSGVSRASDASSLRVVTASFAKQNFGEVLALVAAEPVGIEKHGKLVAVLASAQRWERSAPSVCVTAESELAQRKAARLAQQQLERDRLMHHQRVGIGLLSAPGSEQAQLLSAARATVARWAERRVCSQDFIDQWTAWLALPIVNLVREMCCEEPGSPARAMRQNSPFWYAPFSAPRPQTAQPEPTA